MPVRDSSPEIAALGPPPPGRLNTWRLAALTFFTVSGGPFGLEGLVSAGGPLASVLGLLIVPWVWGVPMALMTAELSSAIPEMGGYIVWPVPDKTCRRPAHACWRFSVQAQVLKLPSSAASVSCADRAAAAVSFRPVRQLQRRQR